MARRSAAEPRGSTANATVLPRHSGVIVVFVAFPGPPAALAQARRWQRTPAMPLYLTPSSPRPAPQARSLTLRTVGLLGRATGGVVIALEVARHIVRPGPRATE